MPELRTVIDDERAPVEGVRPFPVELFECCSKEELCSLLILMHRLLNVEQQKDIDSLLIDLPRFVRESLSVSMIPCAGDVPPSDSEMDRKAYRVADYLLSCLVRAQARIETKPPQQQGAPQPISSRELTVLGWMKEGKTNWEIAHILGLSERTIRFHAQRIFEKLGVASRTQAVARALGAGLIAS